MQNVISPTGLRSIQTLNSHSDADSLGKFFPTKLDARCIAEELQIWLAVIGITSARIMHKDRLPIEVRAPEEHIKLATAAGLITIWHKDGLGKYDCIPRTVHSDGTVRLDTDVVPSILWMILWSNRTPTELMTADWARIYFGPYDVVLVNNHNIYHRCPPSEDGRWFVRLPDPIIKDYNLE